MPRKQKPNKKPKNLYKYNLVMGLLHLFQGVAMLVLSNGTLTPVKIFLPQPNVASRSAEVVGESFYDLNLGYFIALFLFLSAVAHLVTIIPAVYKWYLANLEKELNMIRWYEYALSSSVMIVVIGALSFVQDSTILFLLFVINMSMNLFGAMMERYNSLLKQQAKKFREVTLNTASKSSKITAKIKSTYKTDWTSFVYGSIVGVMPWIVLGLYFFVTLDRVENADQVPGFVKAILPTLFIFFNLFAINMYLQYKKIGKWKSYLFGEYAYIFLSLAAKSTLAWIIFGGTLS